MDDLPSDLKAATAARAQRARRTEGGARRALAPAGLAAGRRSRARGDRLDHLAPASAGDAPQPLCPERADAGGRRHRRQGRHADDAQRTRHGDAAGHRDGATQISGQLMQVGFTGRPDGQEGRFPGRRSTRGPIRRRSTRPRASCGATRRCSTRRRSISRATRSWRRRTRSPSSRSTTSLPRPAVPGHGQGRPGARSTTPSSTSPIATSSRRSPAGSACARSIPGNYVQTSRRHRHRGHHPDAADHGDLHRCPRTTCRRCMKRAARRRDPAGRPPTTAARRPSSPTGTLLDARQPDRHHHRHGEAAGACSPTTTRRCSPTSSSTSGCWSTR